MFPVFVVEIAFFGWSSVEVVGDVPNPVFDSGTFSVHVHVWGDFELDWGSLSRISGFEPADAIQVFIAVPEVSGEADLERELSSVLFYDIDIGMGSCVHDHFICGHFLGFLDGEAVFIEALLQWEQ